jgi:hypothetical protein
MALKILKEICHCSHDKDTHIPACSGVFCDCLEYCDRTKPDTRSGPETEESPASSAPQTHDMYCTCPACILGPGSWGP